MCFMRCVPYQNIPLAEYYERTHHCKYYAHISHHLMQFFSTINCLLLHIEFCTVFYC